MIAVVDVKIQAENPSMPLWPMKAYVGSPSSIRVRNVPKKIGDWCISKIVFVANYPDNTTQTVECKLIGGVYVGTIDGSTRSGTVEQGYSIIADGVDENGNAVNGYVLGKGDVEILVNDTHVNPDEVSYGMRLFEDESEQPKSGDVWLGEDSINIVDVDGNTKTFTPPDLSDYALKSWVEGKGYLTSVPVSYKTYADTKTQLEADGFATQSWVGSQGYLTASTFTAKKLYNDSEDQYVNGDCQVFKQETVFSPWSFSDGGTREVTVWYQDQPYPDTPWVICGSDCETLPYQDCFYSTKEEAETTLSFTYPFESSPGEWVDVVATRTSSSEWVLNASLATMNYVDTQIGLVLSEAF